MINWVLQKNLTRPDILARIKSALNGRDEIWEEVEVVPFSNEVPEIVHKNHFNLTYGSTTLMFNAYHNESLKEGLFFDPAKFQMKNYVKQWGSHVLNADGHLWKFGEIRNFKSGNEKKWFIRPNTDGKAFGGRVDTFEALIAWSDKVCPLGLPELNATTEVWIAAPKEIKKEWRLFIVDDEIVSTSRYMNKGALDESNNDIPSEMMNYAQQRIAAYRIEDVYVMDIAEIDNQYKLIECNCFNGTGFYHHDIERIVRAVNNFIKQKIKKGE